VITAALAPTGPYVINGATLPADALPAVKDIQPYIDNEAAGPALEFLSPVKGPSLEQITVAVGSGINSAEEGAALYDQDVEKQAKQLGLPGW
jgi:raffinose/stachyose/melibiose transport system substrate-binding protein